jgi:transcriptional regulator with XRE-family HTH domain
MGIGPSPRRRSRGLRREEVAGIAGVGVSWYTWLEQGREIRVSSEVLRRVSKALRLNREEVLHVFGLAGLEPPEAPPPCTLTVNPTLQRVLDNLVYVPAYVHNSHWDRIAWNDAALALMGDFGSSAPEQRNTVWRTFANPEVQEYTLHWKHMAEIVVAEFNATVSRHFDDPWLMDFVLRLSAVSPYFRECWARREVIARREEKTVIKHASAGALYLERSVFQVPYDPGLSVILFTPLPTEDSPRRLRELVDEFKRRRAKHRDGAS